MFLVGGTVPGLTTSLFGSGASNLDSLVDEAAPGFAVLGMQITDAFSTIVSLLKAYVPFLTLDLDCGKQMDRQ